MANMLSQMRFFQIGQAGLSLPVVMSGINTFALCQGYDFASRDQFVELDAKLRAGQLFPHINTLFAEREKVLRRFAHQALFQNNAKSAQPKYQPAELALELSGNQGGYKETEAVVHAAGSSGITGETNEGLIVSRILSELHPALHKYKSRFESALKGVWLPENRKTREEFLTAVDEYIENNLIVFYWQRLKGAAEHPVKRFLSDAILENKIKRVERYLNELKDLTLIAMRSKKPSTYMSLMARPDFDSYSFIRSMHIFSGGREISFDDVQKEKAETGREILELVKDGSDEALLCLCRKVVEICNEFIQKEEDSEWDIFWNTFLILSASLNNVALASELLKSIERFPDHFYDLVEEEVVKGIGEHHLDETVEAMLAEHGLLALYLDDHFELMSFSRTFALGTLVGYIENETGILERRRISGKVYKDNRMLLANDDKATVQHELQHLFDIMLGIHSSPEDEEYRAKLAEIVFSDKAREVAICILSNTPAELLFRAVMQSEASDKNDDPLRVSRTHHIHANERIELEMSNAWEDADMGMSKALHLLNEEYQKICGLSYDEILEPFMRPGANQAR